MRGAQLPRIASSAANTPDTAARLAMLSRAEGILLTEGPVIPIYHYTLSALVKPYVRGIHPTPLDVHPLKDVWIDHGGATTTAAAEVRP